MGVRVRQLKGMKHAKLIKKRAMKMWRKTYSLRRDLWKPCLKAAMEEHRRKIEMEIVSKKIEEQLSFEGSFPCDTNGWIS